MSNFFPPGTRLATREETERCEGLPAQLGKAYPMPATDEQRAAETLRRQAAMQARAQGPTAVLRALQPGQSHLFEQFKLTAQLSPYIGRLWIKEGLRFRSRRLATGVEVTRVGPPEPAHPADGLV